MKLPRFDHKYLHTDHSLPHLYAEMDSMNTKSEAALAPIILDDDESTVQDLKFFSDAQEIVNEILDSVDIDFKDLDTTTNKLKYWSYCVHLRLLQAMKAKLFGRAIHIMKKACPSLLSITMCPHNRLRICIKGWETATVRADIFDAAVVKTASRMNTLLHAILLGEGYGFLLQ